MAIEETPLGFKKPDGTTELVKRGADVISHNAQTAEDLLQGVLLRYPNHFDGGDPDTVYLPDMIIDGGAVDG